MKWNSSDWLALGVVAFGMAVVSLERAPLAETHHKLTQGSDAYLLPPPEQTVVMSLGYRSALADLIFGHVLVSVGMHLAEHRLFEFAAEYIDEINELDPTFRDPYRVSDAVITLQTVAVPEEYTRKARKILLRGTRARPYDQELWSAAGQFLAYLAPTRLSNPAEAEEFRQDGARLLARACELIGSNENIPYQCITAAALFSEAGDQKTQRTMLMRLRNTSDDPKIQQMVEAQLAALPGDDLKQKSRQHSERFAKLWSDDLPFVSRAGLGALGPRFDPAACAGKREHAADDVCATALRERLATSNED